MGQLKDFLEEEFDIFPVNISQKEIMQTADDLRKLIRYEAIVSSLDQCNFQSLKNINHKGTLNPNMKVFAITVLTVVIKLCVNVILRIISKLNMREFVIVVINVITKHRTHKS